MWKETNTGEAQRKSQQSTLKDEGRCEEMTILSRHVNSGQGKNSMKSTLMNQGVLWEIPGIRVRGC